MAWPFKTNKNDSKNDRLRRRPTNLNLGTPTAFSYHARRSIRPDQASGGRVVNSSVNNQQPEKHFSRTKKLMAIAVLIVIFLGVIFELFVNTNPKIIIIEPSGFSYQAHSLKQYRLSAKKAINSSIYNRLKLTISSKDIQNNMINTDREIQFVFVTVPLIGSTPTFYIQLSRPVLIYRVSSSSYLLSSDGTVISRNYQLNNVTADKLPVIQASSNNSLIVGDRVLTSSNVNFILAVFAALSAKNISVSHVNLLSSAEELDVYIKNEPYFIKFNLSQSDALQQVGTYLATIANLNQQGKAPAQYVDVRVDGRAYYK